MLRFRAFVTGWFIARCVQDMHVVPDVKIPGENAGGRGACSSMPLGALVDAICDWADAEAAPGSIGYVTHQIVGEMPQNADSIWPGKHGVVDLCGGKTAVSVGVGFGRKAAASWAAYKGGKLVCIVPDALSGWDYGKFGPYGAHADCVSAVWTRLVLLRMSCERETILDTIRARVLQEPVAPSAVVPPPDNAGLTDPTELHALDNAGLTDFAEFDAWLDFEPGV